MSTLRIMSQNQWNTVENREKWAEAGYDCSAEYRMPGHIQVFKELMPDVVGCQETNHDMLNIFGLLCLEKNLPYTAIWGNYTPILYRADKLELLNAEFMPHVATIPGYDGCFNDVQSKSCNLAVFRNKESGKVFIFATNHLWFWVDEHQPGSELARKIQLKDALELVEKYRKMYDNCPAIVVGDLNTGYNSPAVQYAINEGGYTHAYHLATDYRFEGTGYNGCGINGAFWGTWEDKPFEEAIDHILVKDAPEGSVKNFNRHCPDYYLEISDHAPVYIDIEL